MKKRKIKNVHAENEALWNALHAAQSVIETGPQDVEMREDEQALHDECLLDYREAMKVLREIAGKQDGKR